MAAKRPAPQGDLAKLVALITSASVTSGEWVLTGRPEAPANSQVRGAFLALKAVKM
jgi:hypothetical protein